VILPASPTRLLLISENFPPRIGGSSRWFWELYRRLPVEAVKVAGGQHPQSAPFDAAQAYEIQRLPLTMSQWGVLDRRGAYCYWQALQSLRRMLRTARPSPGGTMIHAARCLPEGWLAWMLSWTHGIPYAVYVHGEDVTTAATSREHRAMVRRVFARAKFIIANSQNTATILREHWQLPDAKVRVIYPGVDTRRYTAAPQDEAVRADLDWNDRQVVLTVGRLQQRKGQDMLIQALPLVRERYPNVLYAICGEGEEEPRLRQLVANHQLEAHVQFLGAAHDDRLLAAYQQCDLFALPNRTIDHDIEGFGMVLLEAQACGKAVIAGDSGGTRETLLPGETGWIVDCTDPAPLAEKLIAAFSEQGRLEQMGRRARQWVVERFDWESLAGQAWRVFQGETEAARKPAPNSLCKQEVA
jgi:phosphatidylinositol alpha-1,6-mannosyltransferase